MNPLELSGPHFLAFYPIVFAAALIFLLILRRTLRSGVAQPTRQPPLDESELGFLAGGAVRAVQTALVAMGSRGLVLFKDKGFIPDLGPGSARAQNFVEREVEAAIRTKPGATFQQILSSTRGKLQPLDDRLASAGLLVPKSTRSMYSMIGVMVILLMVALAVAKIYVGMARHRPVGLLIVEAVFGAILLGVAAGAQPRLSRAGKQVLADWKAKLQNLPVPTAGGAETALLLNVAVLGPAVLAGTMLSEFQQPLQLYTGAGGGGDGGGGSSCGGGGGCGGGGCGGCGGG